MPMRRLGSSHALEGRLPKICCTGAGEPKEALRKRKMEVTGLEVGSCCRTSEMSDQATMKGAFCPALSFVVRIASSESIRFVV